MMLFPIVNQSRMAIAPDSWSWQCLRFPFDERNHKSIRVYLRLRKTTKVIMADTNSYGIIWDVDGTLVDTARLHFDAWVRLAGELGRPFTDADFAATFGRRNPEIIHFLFGDSFSKDEGHELGERKERYYRAEAEKGVELLPGVRQLLEGFHRRGIPQGIGSSAPRGNLELILRITDSLSFFSGVVGMEDTQRGKPDPEVFQVAAAKIGVPASRCLVFEDAVAGIQAANAGGMKSIGVTFVGHHPAEKLRAAGADHIVRTLEELSVEDVLRLIDNAA
jgi:beta-phosphoglucomutase